MRTSRPVSSATSRIAVSSRVSPALGVPFGRVQVTMSRSRRREPTTRCGSPSSNRTTIPPADVAVVVLSRATAPWRRWTGGPSRLGRNAPSASRSQDEVGRPSLDAAGPRGRRATRREAGQGRFRPDGGGPWRRVVAAWNEPAARRPRCRSRARDDGCTNRAAERAAYFAAMLSSTGPMVPLQTGVASDDRRFPAASGVRAPRASARAISRSAAAR